jgi:hypothetical protein
VPEVAIPELDTGFIFRRRPLPIPGDLRPGWRIGIIVFLLRKCCRSGRSSFSRLHVLSWGVRTQETRDILLAVVSGTSSPSALIVRIEPSLNRAVDLAIGEGLIRRIGGDKVELTPAGVAVANDVDAAAGAFDIERAFANAIRRRLTEQMVTNLFA